MARATLILPVLLLALGCVTSHYKKTVTVTRDAEGNIQSIVEREEVYTPNQSGYGISFDYLPGIQPGNDEAEKPY